MNINEFLIVLYKTSFTYFFLIIIFKIMGKREVGNVSTFDIVVFFIISELFSLSLNDVESSIWKSIIPITIIVLLDVATAFISMKSKKIREFMEGNPTYLIFNGKLIQENLRKEKFSISDLMKELRINGIQSPSEVQFCLIESNGKISIVKKDQVAVKALEPYIEDGELNMNSLLRYKKTEKDINEILKQKGYSSIQEIFFMQEELDDFLIIKKEDVFQKE